MMAYRWFHYEVWCLVLLVEGLHLAFTSRRAGVEAWCCKGDERRERTGDCCCINVRAWVLGPLHGETASRAAGCQ